MATRVSLARVRAHWHQRSGLASPVSGEPDDVVAQTGWLRTLGGVDAYLAARARVPGLSRAGLDALVEASRLRVIPAVRGCVYLVPAAHAPLALRVAQDPWRKSAERDLQRTGVTWKEVEELGRGIVQLLAREPATTATIRKELPPGAVRSLGEVGKKVGLSSPLPVALDELELRGVIERTLEGGRLDSQRYLWRLASPDAGWTALDVPDEAIDRWAALARIFLGYAGPATAADFAGWTGLSQRDARAALEKAGAAPLAVEPYAPEGGAWVLPEDLDALARPAEPTSAVALLSFEDNYLVAHGGPKWVVDPAHWSRPIQVWGNTKGGTLGDAAHIQTRTVIVGDELAGIWEMDPDARQVRWATFDPVSREARDAIDQLAAETARFLTEEIGHAHSFSLDTDEEVRERVAEVARVAGRGKVAAVNEPEQPQKKPEEKAKPTPKAAAGAMTKRSVAATRPAPLAKTPAAKAKPAATKAKPAAAKAKPAAAKAKPAAAKAKPAAPTVKTKSAKTKPSAAKAPAPKTKSAATSKRSPKR